MLHPSLWRCSLTHGYAPHGPDWFFNLSFVWVKGYPTSVGHPVLIDLLHRGRPRAVAAYLVTEPEPALIDCGPASCLPTLESALSERGLGIGDLRHLLLTHIHLDHAGAAGALVAANPRLLVHVSAAGARHLV